MPEAALSTGFEPVQTALALAGGRGFSDAFGPGSGPTAHTAPLHPAWLAVWLKLLGHSEAWAITVTCWTIAIHGLIAALLPLLSRKIWGIDAPGLGGSLLLIVLPLFPVIPQFETAMTMAAILLYMFLPEGTLRRGTATGLIFHINPAALFVLGPVELAGSMAHFRRWLAVAAVICTPWTIRNFVELGQLMFIRDGLPLELQIGNNDLAGVSLFGNSAAHRAHHPTANASERSRLREMGEAEYQRSKLREFLDWVREHPGRFAALSAQRVVLFWFPVTASGWLHQAGAVERHAGEPVGPSLLAARVVVGPDRVPRSFLLCPERSPLPLCDPLDLAVGGGLRNGTLTATVAVNRASLPNRDQCSRCPGWSSSYLESIASANFRLSSSAWMRSTPWI